MKKYKNIKTIDSVRASQLNPYGGWYVHGVPIYGWQYAGQSRINREQMGNFLIENAGIHAL